MPELLESLGVSDLAELGWRLLLNQAAALIVVKVVYDRVYGRRDYVFTYFLFNLITFVLCFVLRRVPIELGFALGMFALFGILRYRTEAIRLRDLTYLFVVIGLAILNGIADIGAGTIVGINAVITLAVVLLERVPFGERVEEQAMTYDKLELLQPSRVADLRADIEERTGLNVKRVSVEHIDLVRDIAKVTVYHARGK